MSVTVLRLGVRVSSAQLLVEYEKSGNDSTSAGVSRRPPQVMHQAVTLQRDALIMDPADLAVQLRASFPQLFPSYVTDECLLPLLRMLCARAASLEGGGGGKGVVTAASRGGGGTTAAVAPAPSSQRGGGGSGAATAAAAAAAAIPSVIASIGDLQRVGPAALQAAKARMDVVFEAHRLKPGDDGFVYDKRADFAPPTEESDWD